jgi:hypothetical protein
MDYTPTNALTQVQVQPVQEHETVPVLQEDVPADIPVVVESELVGYSE